MGCLVDFYQNFKFSIIRLRGNFASQPNGRRPIFIFWNTTSQIDPPGGPVLLPGHSGDAR